MYQVLLDGLNTAKSVLPSPSTSAVTERGDATRIRRPVAFSITYMAPFCGSRAIAVGVISGSARILTDPEFVEISLRRPVA